MKQKPVILFLIFNCFISAQSKGSDYSENENIQNIITLFQKKDIRAISKIVRYPLRREYPIPDIKNEREFAKRFNDLFDQRVMKEISESEISDWSEAGWRGIMLNHGTLWIDSEGKIIALNHQSEWERKLRLKIIEEQRNNLHRSLKSFKNPQYVFRTKHYLIRIDELESGKYRYASWKKDGIQSSMPDLILSNGDLQFSGSGGNHTFTLRKGDCTYTVTRFLIGSEETPEINLSVEEKGKEILNEEGKLL